MDYKLTLNERKIIKSLVLESEGLLTEGLMDKIRNFINKRISPEEKEKVQEKITQNLGVDENSSKEEIEDAIKEKIGRGENEGLLKRVLKEILGFGLFSIIWDLTNLILAGAVVASDYNPIVIVASIIFVIFKNTDTFDKIRRKALGPKIDKFIFGKRSHLGDYDNEKKNSTNESRKKIIRLTESDLTRLIKRIIKESK